MNKKLNKAIVLSALPVLMAVSMFGAVPGAGASWRDMNNNDYRFNRHYERNYERHNNKYNRHWDNKFNNFFNYCYSAFGLNRFNFRS